MGVGGSGCSLQLPPNSPPRPPRAQTRALRTCSREEGTVPQGLLQPPPAPGNPAMAAYPAGGWLTLPPRGFPPPPGRMSGRRRGRKAAARATARSRESGTGARPDLGDSNPPGVAALCSDSVLHDEIAKFSYPAGRSLSCRAPLGGGGNLGGWPLMFAGAALKTLNHLGWS